MTLSAPRPASTVILLRESPGSVASRPLEVFLVKRHAGSKFLGGAHVFPGGAVDPGDLGSADQALADGIPDAVSHLSDLDPREAIGYHIAAIRELFEEAGVLLAKGPAGRLISFANPEVRQTFTQYRKAIQNGRTTLTEVLRREGLRFALDALCPYAHWITPRFEGHRFDTRFFVSVLPPGQTPSHDAAETVEGGWWTPRDALAAYARGEIDLAPPTIHTLDELTPFNTTSDVCAFASSRPIVPIEPRIITTDDGYFLVLPGDPLYPVPPDKAVTGYNRFVREEGRWKMEESRAST